MQWIQLRSQFGGYEIIQEHELKFGPTFVNADVMWDNCRGERVSGVIKAVDRSKKRIIAERDRMAEAITEEYSGAGSDSVSETSSIGRRTRSCSAVSATADGPSTSAAAAASSARAGTPRPSMVGCPPTTVAPPSTRGRRGGRGRGTTRGAPTSTPRRPPVLNTPVPSTVQHGTLVPPPPGSHLTSPIVPLVPTSLLPPGFSLTGSPAPLVPPLLIGDIDASTMDTFADDAAFRMFMMQSQVQTHSELAGIKLMVNNLYLACYPLIVQSADRSTSTHQEHALNHLTGDWHKDFNYDPYPTKAEIDEIDMDQDPQVLATAIESLIYDETDPRDSADLSLSFHRRSNKAKVKWIVECVLHRRMVSGTPLRAAVTTLIVDRIKKYAGDRRREKEKETRARERTLRMSGKRRAVGDGGQEERIQQKRQDRGGQERVVERERGDRGRYGGARDGER